MSTKQINSRIQIKSDTSANWHTASTKGFLPLAGEFIRYTDDFRALKIGDGKHTPDELGWYRDGGLMFLGTLDGVCEDTYETGALTYDTYTISQSYLAHMQTYNENFTKDNFSIDLFNCAIEDDGLVGEGDVWDLPLFGYFIVQSIFRNDNEIDGDSWGVDVKPTDLLIVMPGQGLEDWNEGTSSRHIEILRFGPSIP